MTPLTKTVQTFTQKVGLVSLLSAGLALSLPAQAITYSELLQNILANQPEQATLQGFENLENSANQNANSWFAGNANLIVAHENDALTGDLDKQKWQIGAEMSLWLPGQLDSQQALAQSVGELKNNQAIYLKWQASAQLRDLVWQYRQAQVKTKMAKQSVEQAKRLHQLIESLVRVGEKPKIDALLANKQLLTAQSYLLSLRNDLNTVQNRYQAWTNSQELPRPLAENLADFELANHPQLNQLKAQLGLANAEFQTLKTSEKDNPKLSFGGFQEEDQGTSPNTSLYAQISYPIGSSSMAKVETAKQKNTLLQKQAEIQRVELELKNNLYAAEQQVIVNQKKLQLIQEEVLLDAETLDLAMQAYKAGESNIQTLVNAQQQFLESKLQQALTAIELKKAIAQRNQIAGVSL